MQDDSGNIQKTLPAHGPWNKVIPVEAETIIVDPYMQGNLSDSEAETIIVDPYMEANLSNTNDDGNRNYYRRGHLRLPFTSVAS